VDAQNEPRDLVQEVSAGTSEKTPVAVLTVVIAIVAALVAVALLIAGLAYALA
jgi:hypothetical protein